MLRGGVSEFRVSQNERESGLSSRKHRVSVRRKRLECVIKAKINKAKQNKEQRTVNKHHDYRANHLPGRREPRADGIYETAIVNVPIYTTDPI
jgi:hypothetical protein